MMPRSSWTELQAVISEFFDRWWSLRVPQYRPPVRLSLLTYSVLTLFSGCAYSPVIYRPGLVEQRDLRRPVVTVAPTIDLVLQSRRTTYHGQSAPWQFQVMSSAKVRRALHHAARDFPWLANAKEKAPDARYRLVIEATDAIRTSVLRDALAAISLFLISHRMEWSLDLNARLEDAGRTVGTYQSHAYCTIHEHLLLLPLSLKAAQITAHVREHTFRDLFLQIEHDKTDLFAAAR